MVGASVAIALTCALLLIFRRPQATENAAQKLKPGDITQITKPDDLRESARLAELRIKELSDAVTTVEKKSIQLIALCLALLGYLAVNHGDSAYAIIKLPALVSLFIAGFWGFKAAYLGTHGTMGFNPDSFARCINKGGDASCEVLHCVLKKYQKAIEQINETQKSKVRDVKKAKPFLVIGISFTLGWLIADYLYMALR